MHYGFTFQICNVPTILCLIFLNRCPNLEKEIATECNLVNRIWTAHSYSLTVIGIMHMHIQRGEVIIA